MDYETVIETLTEKIKELEKKLMINEGLFELLAEGKIVVYKDENEEITFSLNK